MNRMTVKRDDGRWAIANNDGSTVARQFEKLPVAIDRLAAYEDTGLEPEEIDELLHKKLVDWISAENDGRLFASPYSIGDTVYLIAIRRKYLQTNLHSLYIKEVEIRLDNLYKYIDKVGKTVFLTREDAEAAIAGQRKEC